MTILKGYPELDRYTQFAEGSAWMMDSGMWTHQWLFRFLEAPITDPGQITKITVHMNATPRIKAFINARNRCTIKMLQTAKVTVAP